MGPDAKWGGRGASPRPPPPLPHGACDVPVGGRPRGRQKKPAQTQRRPGRRRMTKPARGHWIGDESRIRGRSAPPCLGIDGLGTRCADGLMTQCPLRRRGPTGRQMAEAPAARRAKLPIPATNRLREEQKRARKEESYLENEYLRARRKNLRSSCPAATIEGVGAGEQRRLSLRTDPRVGTSGCRCRSLATVCVSLIRLRRIP